MNQKIVKALPFFCVPATLEMVLQRYGYTHLNQNEIAKQFAINTDPKSDENTWGVKINTGMLNAFFRKNSIDLVEIFISIHSFYDEYDMAEKIEHKLSTSQIICGYNYSSLFGNDESKFGHVSLISEVSNDLKKITILDPGPKNFGIKQVKAEDLFYAVRRADDGFWCISPQ